MTIRNEKVMALVAFMLVAALVFGFGACKDNKSDDSKAAAPAKGAAYDIYKAAYEKFDTAKGVTMNMGMDMKIGGEGMELTIKTTGPVEMNRPSEDVLDMKIAQNMETFGQSIDMTIYYKDGYLYTDVAGQKIKQKLSAEEAMKQANYSDMFPEEAIKDQSVKDVEGGVELSFVVDGSALKDMIAGELAELGTSEDGANFKDANVVTVISKDGDLISQSIKMDFSMNIEGTDTEASIDVSISDIKIGDVKIDFPDDLDSYTESDLGI